MKVILGTAHGSNVGGKCSPDKSIREYQWSREMCLMIKERLDTLNIDCVIDILEPVEKSLNYRAQLVNKIVRESNDDCIYISVHLNAAGNDGKWYTASGWTVYVYNKCSAKSKALALSLFDVAKEKDLFGNRCLPKTGYYTANFCVLRETICPAILTENLFQDNKKEVEYLLSQEGKENICDLHVNGILRYIENNCQ
jgi:N-acetylmuramoyl-L-alanine amidase